MVLSCDLDDKGMLSYITSHKHFGENFEFRPSLLPATAMLEAGGNGMGMSSQMYPSVKSTLLQEMGSLAVGDSSLQLGKEVFQPFMPMRFGQDCSSKIKRQW